jgi:16S rRNA (adenine(1408)-N(1))-methyltransferase
MAPYAGRVHIDLGSGDGRGPYHWASREPSRLFIASDANLSALTDIAWRAGRKTARGGISNLICIAEPLDLLAVALADVADRITVILPWGSLLRAVAAPEIESLRHLARLCLPKATIEIVLSYDEQRDVRQSAPLRVGGLDEEHMRTTLPCLYEQAGLLIVAAEQISQRELADCQTTWAKRLAFGRPRNVWRLRARYAGRGENGAGENLN